MFLVTAGWAFFRADNIQIAISYLKKMLGIGTQFFTTNQVFYQMIENRFYIVIAIVGMLPIFPWIVDKLKLWEEAWWKNIVAFGFYIVLGILVLTNVLSSSYNPFIYFNF